MSQGEGVRVGGNTRIPFPLLTRLTVTSFLTIKELKKVRIRKFPCGMPSQKSVFWKN